MKHLRSVKSPDLWDDETAIQRLARELQEYQQLRDKAINDLATAVSKLCVEIDRERKRTA